MDMPNSAEDVFLDLVDNYERNIDECVLSGEIKPALDLYKRIEGARDLANCLMLDLDWKFMRIKLDALYEKILRASVENKNAPADAGTSTRAT